MRFECCEDPHVASLVVETPRDSSPGWGMLVDVSFAVAALRAVLPVAPRAARLDSLRFAALIPKRGGTFRSCRGLRRGAKLEIDAVMRRISCSRSTSLLVSVALALPLTVGCGAASDDTSDSDLAAAAAKEAEGERLTDADKALNFADGEEPDTQVEEPAFPWGQIFWFTHDSKVPVGKDWFPVGYDFVAFPIAVVKLLVAIPNKVGDWFRAFNYANFSLPNATSEPLKVNARLAVANLNWYFSRGKASLRVCNVRASGVEYGCSNLGSVKEGKRTTSYFYDGFGTAWGIRERELKLRHYTRDYALVIPPGESLHVQIKHKFECNVDERHANGQVGGKLSDCRIRPSPSIQFTKVP